MKKTGREKRGVGEAKTLPHPDEMRGAQLEAIYGDDALNELLWDLRSAKSDVEFCHELAPHAPIISAMITRIQARGPDEDQKTLLPDFYEAVSKALLDSDAGFFREVARLLETRLEGPPERRLDMEVVRAFNFLRARAKWRKEPLPTKCRVREVALRLIAFSNVMNRRGSPEKPARVGLLSGVNWRTQLEPEILEAVEREIELLPEQNWTRIFERCGLADLPADKGGQPRHRQRRKAASGRK